MLYEGETRNRLEHELPSCTRTLIFEASDPAPCSQKGNKAEHENTVLLDESEVKPGADVNQDVTVAAPKSEVKPEPTIKLTAGTLDIVCGLRKTAMNVEPLLVGEKIASSQSQVQRAREILATKARTERASPEFGIQKPCAPETIKRLHTRRKP